MTQGRIDVEVMDVLAESTQDESATHERGARRTHACRRELVHKEKGLVSLLTLLN